MEEVEEKFWHFQISFSFWQKIHSSSKMLLWQKLVPNAREEVEVESFITMTILKAIKFSRVCGCYYQGNTKLPIVVVSM